jgi:hypothetical protein
MNEIDHFKNFIFYISDVSIDVDHLYVKKIYLMSFSYRVTGDMDPILI